MKKSISVIIFLLVSILLPAQSRFSCSLELMSGAGVWKGPLFTVAPELVVQYDLWAGFKMGVGTGARYTMPCLQYITNNGTHPERSFCNELDIPVFLRFGYGKEKLYANLDAGYAIDILSFYGSDWIPGGKKDPCYNGLFFEPQIGWRMNRRSALALGILLQQSTVERYVKTESGERGTPSHSISADVYNQHLFTPAITLRYGFFF